MKDAHWRQNPPRSLFLSPRRKLGGSADLGNLFAPTFLETKKSIELEVLPGNLILRLSIYFLFERSLRYGLDWSEEGCQKPSLSQVSFMPMTQSPEHKYP